MVQHPTSPTFRSVQYPNEVSLEYSNAGFVVQGPLGSTRVDGSLLRRNLVSCSLCCISRTVKFTALQNTNEAHAAVGTLQRTLQAACVGVCEGVLKQLELVGVGYRASVTLDTPQILTLKLGMSHDCTYTLPLSVRCACPTPTTLTLVGVDEFEVGYVAAQIVGFRLPDAYKGKGIRYSGSSVSLKEGKKK
uniref:Ribosomal protein L6 n=1 Tax=prasinophyte sp. MBIC10622 TaxID=156113 RepID=A0A650AKG3_9CHLO|nr:ribosomal protein L6 [prasinophyte sp. MBIC10622]